MSILDQVDQLRSQAKDEGRVLSELILVSPKQFISDSVDLNGVRWVLKRLLTAFGERKVEIHSSLIENQIWVNGKELSPESLETVARQLGWEG